MSERNHVEDENRALAFAALALAKALMNTLEQKGILDGSETEGVLDQALTSLEFRHQDVSIDLARRILEATAITRAARKPRDGDGSGGSENSD